MKRTTDEYQPQYCAQLIEHMAYGFSFETFAARIGVSEETLHHWLEQFPDLKKAQAKGEIAARLYWEKIGLAAVMGKIPGFNEALWLSYMQQRFGWCGKEPPMISRADKNFPQVSLYLPDNGRDNLSVELLNAPTNVL